MDNNSFLRKFKGRTEIIGKTGLLPIMDNLHMNIIGYRPKQKKNLSIKLKNKRILDNDYSYVSSIVKEEFNKNIDFVPQLKISASNNSNLTNLINKNSTKNPLKLYKIVEKDNDEKKVIRNINTNIDNSKSMKLPLINHKDKTIEKNILRKENKLNVIKSYEKKNNFALKNKFLNQDAPLKIKKKILKNNRNYRKVNNLQNDNSFNIKKNHSLSSRNIFEKNNSKNDIINIQNNYNNILNKIKNDFLLLDSIKTRINKLQRNNSYLDNKNNIQLVDKKSPYELKDYNIYNDENKNINIKKDNNLLNIRNNKSLLNKIKNNTIDDNSKNINYYKEINYPKKNEKFFGNKLEKEETNFSDNIRKIGLNEKYKIREEISNKNIINNINNDNSEQNDNFLEKLMKQRLNYQNKIPDNSIFKIN